MGASEWIAMAAVLVSLLALAGALRANRIASAAERRATESYYVEWGAALSWYHVHVWNDGLDRATDVRWRLVLADGHVGDLNGTEHDVARGGTFSVPIFEELKTISGVKNVDFELSLYWRSPAGNPYNQTVKGVGSTGAADHW